jgi:uncharacterized membrane protein
MQDSRLSSMKHSLLWIAVLLIVIWVVARLTLAVTSVALHILWIVAVIMLIVWLIGFIRKTP